MADSDSSTKICSTCGEAKPRGEYRPRKDSVDGLRGACRDCMKESGGAYYQENRPRIDARAAVYRAANREQEAARDAAYRTANRDRITAYKAGWYRSNRTRELARGAARRARNKRSRSEQQAIYRRKNRDRIKRKTRAYRKRNPAKVRLREYRHRLEHPRRWRARLTVRTEVRAGRLSPSPCETCGLTPLKVNGRQRIEAHHHKGYAKEFWLDVAWLCSDCHGTADRLMRLQQCRPLGE